MCQKKKKETKEARVSLEDSEPVLQSLARLLESSVGTVLSCAYWYIHGSIGRSKGTGRIALSCHFAPDILCDKSEVRCAQ